MKITTSDIEQILQRIVDKLRNDNVDQIELNLDNYWLISTDEWDNFDRIVPPVVGSLKDDIENLILVRDGKQIITYLDFERVASLLRAVSESIIPTKS